MIQARESRRTVGPLVRDRTPVAAEGPLDDEWVRGVACNRAVLLLNTGRVLIQRGAFQFREFVQFGEKTASIWRGLSADVLTINKSVGLYDGSRLTNVSDE